MALKVGSSSREGSVAPRAVNFLLFNLFILVRLSVPLHAVRSWLPWLQLWDRSRCNLWQERRGEGGGGGLKGSRWQLGKRLEQRRLVNGGGDGCSYLGAVHVPLRGCQRGKGKVGRVYVESSGTHGAAAAHLDVMEKNVRLGKKTFGRKM